MRETTEHFSQNIQCSSGDSNWALLVLFQILAVEVCICLLLGLSRYLLLVWYYIFRSPAYLHSLSRKCLPKKSLPGKEEENLSSQSRKVLGRLLVSLRRYFHIPFVKFWARLLLCNSYTQNMRGVELPP